MQRYSEFIEQKMLLFYQDLGERERRHYAYLESEKLGYGGKKYIRDLLKISYKTIRKAGDEIKNPSLFPLISKDRQRKKGGGRPFFLSNLK